MTKDKNDAPQNPTACLIIIGNEVLSGRTQDANLAYLAQGLNDVGVRLAEARVIPDVEAIIVKTLNQCRKAHTYVFTTGGIGATHDDITAEAVAKAFGRPLLCDARAVKALEEHYGDRLNDARLKMAEMPEGAELIDNPVSHAPGFHIGNVYVFAGVPKIMQAMFDGVKHTLKGGAVWRARSLSTDLTEGVIAGEMALLQDDHKDVEIGSYPHFKDGRLGVALVVRGADAGAIDETVAALEAMVRAHDGAVFEDPP
ncbi:competence/damage-inducible protein A [Varunaivibrio sulfuroxidans]|uniref:Molybdenum cofactor synthesis domain-containing protein n=1 Tax=Varunaivibrio sulfuroxidans TaxID=1773489 RepID=A0A4R3JCV1_9PROT|nr:molybdopterin-binding protein [Varunaivibrio sulfuroxidans]TCS63494.1 molybdenum cofactor synthesis domain-containing protein [Varunaivibrio sulfuroxidans]WES30361.1 molybdopterin-binding protein [Varunaivibrio sulfuroxidans]